ncbi:hypothetical protein NMR73_004130 [Vibrio navarrensis]|uniref:hypothetical protein n=1 Tax=Vibrio navarrensis TaxID=29495 RepID=UPI001558B497|nr:hypothetical protein [Vibrio navarrensis]EJL6401061.1 hypothetical protein [Vibrio navarrensis]EJL6568434.1 hypothetical protein [Vibrio navarrensis]
MSKQKMFDRLVENAFDFLERSVEDIELRPKYSIIHFHAALELFLKARLMHEHWTLVISDNQKPDWNKFTSGNFQSVSLLTATERLDKVVCSGLTKQELQSFKDVTSHRNKVVHFFHEAHSYADNKKNVQDIVKQQLSAWQFLHKLIGTRWNQVFAGWEAELASIDWKLRSLNSYLQVVYDQKKKNIEILKKKGDKITTCSSCGFESMHETKSGGLVEESSCLVCRHDEKRLAVSCSDCEGELIFVNEGFGTCPTCNKKYEPSDVVELLIDDGAAHIAAMEGDNSWDLGHCSFCEGYETVVRTEADEFVCTSCLIVTDGVAQCGWCSALNNGDLEFSFASGCVACDGRVGWDD